MKKSVFLLALILFGSNFLFAQTWDVLDKTMGAYNQNEGLPTNLAWAVVKGTGSNAVITQQTGYVSFTKTVGKYSWLRPATAIAQITSGLAYSVEVKVRVNPIDKVLYPDGTTYEANQIALRMGVLKIATPIYLRYGDGVTGGSVSTVSGAQNAYQMNTSDWQIYRIVLNVDHTKYDVYVAGVEEPVFENIAIVSTGDQNGVYFGAESTHRCNMDIEYVKMGTGDFFSKPSISSVALSREHHMTGNVSTVSVTANTKAISDGEELLFSLVDGVGNVIVSSVSGTVAGNVATANIEIPSDIVAGKYFVKVAALNDQIGTIALDPKTSTYYIDPASQWDIVEKPMTAWDADGGSYTNRAWSIIQNVASGVVLTQQSNYVNITKTNTAATYCYAFMKSSALSLEPSTPYSVEVKVRLNAIDKVSFPDTETAYESNQMAVRLNGKNAPLYLRYGDATNGSVSLTEAGASPYLLNTSEWQRYRFVFHADAASYDVYINDLQAPVFSNVATTTKGDANGVYFGTESYHRCNMDIEYVYMATGDLYSSDLTSVELPGDAAGDEISVFPNMLNAGQAVTVKTPKTDVSLSEVVVYNLTGKEVYHTIALGNMVELKSPAVAGMYLLRAILSDKTAKEFKIIVK